MSQNSIETCKLIIPRDGLVPQKYTLPLDLIVRKYMYLFVTDHLQ